ncbi:LuxR C-terminal-related transcriptional regulator [Sulfitobacter aestuarii]|uniref:LuxR C-terminal-related transcriptional regulator n=1 Tax=Sulfitobacter aestuarii TaxID=2161676 RepID=A0ABW5TY91_9RHOB
MKPEIIELAGRAASLGSSDELWNVCQQMLPEYGVTAIGYGIIPLAAEARRLGNATAGYFRNTYPQDWAAGGDDPINDKITIDKVRDGARLVFWEDPRLLDGARPAQIRRRAHEAEIGMRQGVSIGTSFAQNGRPVSGLAFAFGTLRTYKEMVAHWREYSYDLNYISQIIDNGFRGPSSILLPQLSQRERDCLSYLVIGMRPAEISHALNISEKTLEKHIGSAKHKLNARTRDQALVKALVLNLIDP